MEIIAAILVGIVALEHLFIMILEMFFMNSKVAKRAFKLPEHLEGDRNVAIMFANQGLYNGFFSRWSHLGTYTWSQFNWLYGSIILCNMCGSSSSFWRFHI